MTVVAREYWEIELNWDIWRRKSKDKIQGRDLSINFSALENPPPQERERLWAVDWMNREKVYNRYRISGGCFHENEGMNEWMIDHYKKTNKRILQIPKGQLWKEFILSWMVSRPPGEHRARRTWDRSTQPQNLWSGSWYWCWSDWRTLFFSSESECFCVCDTPQETVLSKWRIVTWIIRLISEVIDLAQLHSIDEMEYFPHTTLSSDQKEIIKQKTLHFFLSWWVEIAGKFL